MCDKYKVEPMADLSWSQLTNQGWGRCECWTVHKQGIFVCFNTTWAIWISTYAVGSHETCSVSPECVWAPAECAVCVFAVVGCRPPAVSVGAAELFSPHWSAAGIDPPPDTPHTTNTHTHLTLLVRTFHCIFGIFTSFWTLIIKNMYKNTTEFFFPQ